MNVRLRILVVVAFTLIILFAVLHAASSSILATAVLFLERQAMSEELEWGRATVDESLAAFRKVANHWATGDHADAFIGDRIDRLAPALAGIDADVVLHLAADGALINGAQRTEAGATAPAPALVEALRAQLGLSQSWREGGASGGFARLADGPVMIAAERLAYAPVATGSTLVAVRHLTPERLQRMGAARRLSLTLAPLAEAVEPNAVHVGEDGAGTAWFSLVGLDGEAMALVRVETPRWITAQLRTHERKLAVAFALAGVLALAIFYVLLERLLLERLARLDLAVSRLPRRGFGTRRGDELEQIDRTIDETLKELQTTRAQRDHDALHDPLTGLANRALFHNRLEAALQKNRRAPQAFCAVLLVDLDHFKLINDSFGHSTGDELLVTAARRMAGCLRQGDTVARLGGDEFAVLIEAVPEVADASRRAERILASLATPVVLHGHQLHLSASIGIAVCDRDGMTADELMRDADIAMYRAKQKGRNCVMLFDERMHEQVVTRLETENELRRAIRDGELRAYYQPFFDLHTRELRGFEALVRWQHATRGLLAPDKFIPVAEASGVIAEIDEWMLHESSRCLARWQRQFRFTRPLTVSINISGRRTAWGDITRHVQSILDETGLDGERIGLEITESALAVAETELVTQLFRLKALGVRLYLDDFGTGYSSLSRLHRLPIDVLKIDRSFVANLEESDGGIARTIVNLARSFGMQVVAEGIESERQAQRLRDLGCGYGQGYLFSRPMAEDEAARYLRALEPVAEGAGESLQGAKIIHVGGRGRGEKR